MLKPPTQLLPWSPLSSGGEATGLKPRPSGSASSQFGLRRPLAESWLPWRLQSAPDRLGWWLLVSWWSGDHSPAGKGRQDAGAGDEGEGRGRGCNTHSGHTWPACGHMDVGEKSPHPFYLSCWGSLCPLEEAKRQVSGADSSSHPSPYKIVLNYNGK